MQTINLYTSEFQPDRSLLQVHHMAILCVVFVGLLFVFSVWYELGTHKHKEFLQHVTVKNEQLTVERDALASVSQTMDSSQLDARLIQLRQKISERLALSGLLGHQELGNDRGFSAQLRTLARHSSEALSLTKFRLGSSGTYVTFEGRAVRSHEIARYLDALQQDKAFAESTFGVLSITPDSGAFRFSVAPSRPDTAAESEQ